MNFKYYSIALVCIVLATHISYAQELTYFLVDKSGSMGAKERATNQSLLDLAKQRVLDEISRNPPSDKGTIRQVRLILFDSSLHGNQSKTRITGIQSAIDLFKTVNADGGTVIGDRLEEVRMDIEKFRPQKVRIHLFSDLEENEGSSRVPLSAAVKRFDKMLRGKKDQLNFRLHAYVWEGLDEELVVDSLQLSDPSLIEIEDVAQPLLAASIDAPTSFHSDLKESGGFFVAASSPRIELSGSLSPELVDAGVSLAIEATFLDDPKVIIHLNGERRLHITEAQSDVKTGRFKYRNVELSFQNATPYLKRMGRQLLEAPSKIRFSAHLSPSPKTLPALRHAKVGKPDTVESFVSFKNAPHAYLRNYAIGSGFYEDQVVEGDMVSIPIEISWNQAAIGTEASWKAPLGGATIAKLRRQDGSIEDEKIVLTDSLYRFYRLELSNLSNVDDSFEIVPTRGEIKPLFIPVVIEPYLPSAAVIPVKNEPIQILSKLENSIPDVLKLYPSPVGRDYYVRLSFNKPPNAKIAFYDPADPDFTAPIDYPVNVLIEKPRLLGLRIQVEDADELTLQVRAQASKPANLQLTRANESDFFVDTDFQINVIDPKLQWRLSSDSGKSLGTRDAPMAFQSRGEAQSTIDPSIERAGFKIDVAFTPRHASQIINGILESSVVSSRRKGKEIVQQVLFEASGDTRCSVEDFLRNPHLSLVVDSSQKPFLGTAKESGIIHLDLVELASETLPPGWMDSVSIHYKMRLRP